jgi:hypothetical protein
MLTPDAPRREPMARVRAAHQLLENVQYGSQRVKQDIEIALASAGLIAGVVVLKLAESFRANSLANFRTKTT